MQGPRAMPKMEPSIKEAKSPFFFILTFPGPVQGIGRISRRLRPTRKKIPETKKFPYAPTSPIMRPARAVMRPITPILSIIPTEKHEDIKSALFADMRPCPSMNPTMRGMLERWHGLKIKLRIPQIKDAHIAATGFPSTACERMIKDFSIIAFYPCFLFRRYWFEVYTKIFESVDNLFL